MAVINNNLGVNSIKATYKKDSVLKANAQTNTNVKDNEVDKEQSKTQDSFEYKGSDNFGAYTKDSILSNTPATTEELAEEVAVATPKEETKGMDISKLTGNDYTNASGKIDIEQMKSDALVSYQNMIQKMLNSQQEDGSIKVPSRVQMAAKASLEGEGHWSPESVAGRIVDMAKALSGGDPAHFETLKEAALKGFEQAEKSWGSKLPSITETTKDLVIKGFDDWYKELNPTVDATV